MSVSRNYSLLLVGPEIERNKWAPHYRRAGFHVVEQDRVGRNEGLWEFIHASVGTSEELVGLIGNVCSPQPLVGISFRLKEDPARVRSLIDLCRDAGMEVLLVFPPIHVESFRRLVHFIDSGIVGEVTCISLLLPRGVPQFVEETLAGEDDGPALAGLAMVTVLAGKPIMWEEGQLSEAGTMDLTKPLVGKAGAVVIRVERITKPEWKSGAQVWPATELVIEGTDSTLALRMEPDRHIILAFRERTRRVLATFPVLDPIAETVAAVSRFLEGRERKYADGHAALRLVENVHWILKALVTPARKGAKNRREGPRGVQHPSLDVYQKLPLRWEGAAPPKPFWEAKFNVETKCNQDCIFCFAKNGNMLVTNLLDLPEIVTGLPARGIKGVIFSGGEPTLNRDVPDYIAQAKRAGIEYVTLESNALVFSNRNEVARYKNAGLDAAFVSFHSVRSKTVELLTKTRRCLPKIIAGINNLLTAGVEVHLNCVINAFNYTELEEVAAFVAHELTGISTITFSFVAPLGRAMGRRDIVPRISHVVGYMHSALLRCEEAGVAALVPGRCGIPLCFLPGLERFFVEYRLREHLHRPRQILKDRVKLPECSYCPLDSCCQGLWRNYADMYGTSELLRR